MRLRGHREADWRARFRNSRALPRRLHWRRRRRVVPLRKLWKGEVCRDAERAFHQVFVCHRRFPSSVLSSASRCGASWGEMSRSPQCCPRALPCTLANWGPGTTPEIRGFVRYKPLVARRASTAARRASITSRLTSLSLYTQGVCTVQTPCLGRQLPGPSIADRDFNVLHKKVISVPGALVRLVLGVARLAVVDGPEP